MIEMRERKSHSWLVGYIFILAKRLYLVYCIPNDFQTGEVCVDPNAVRIHASPTFRSACRRPREAPKIKSRSLERNAGEQGISIGPRQIRTYNLNLLSINCDKLDSMSCCKYFWRYSSLVMKTSLEQCFFNKPLTLQLFTVPTPGTASKQRLDQFHIQYVKDPWKKNCFGVFPDMPKPSQTSNSIECNGPFKAQLDSLTESA